MPFAIPPSDFRPGAAFSSRCRAFAVEPRAPALELAKVAEDRGLREDYIVPTMDDWEVFPREATAVGMKAIEQGVARIKMTREELLKKATATIKQARETTQWMMREGLIATAPAS